MNMYNVYTEVLSQNRRRLAQESKIPYHTLIKYSSSARKPPDNHLKAIKRVIKRQLEFDIKFHEKEFKALSKLRKVLE